MIIEKEFNKKEEFKKINKITYGTREWSDYSVNCINGCSHNCKYCYAKNMAIRFKRKTENNWKKMDIIEEKSKKLYRKRNGRFMFPTTHDITPEPKVLNICMKVLENIVLNGNNVLITTKPHLSVIKKICNNFSDYKNQIQFRFTITSNNNKLLKFWEPGASRFEDRV